MSFIYVARPGGDGQKCFTIMMMSMVMVVPPGKLRTDPVIDLWWSIWTLYQPLAVLNWAPAMPSILVDTKVGEWFTSIARMLGWAADPGPTWCHLEKGREYAGVRRDHAYPWCLGLPPGRENRLESLSVPGVTPSSNLALASSKNMILKMLWWLYDEWWLWCFINALISCKVLFILMLVTWFKTWK